MMRLMALLVEYRAMDGECTFYDWYAATNVYEFVVGVAQVLARKSAHLSKLRAFVDKKPEVSTHVLVILAGE